MLYFLPPKKKPELNLYQDTINSCISLRSTIISLLMPMLAMKSPAHNSCWHGSELCGVCCLS